MEVEHDSYNVQILKFNQTLVISNLVNTTILVIYYSAVGDLTSSSALD